MVSAVDIINTNQRESAMAKLAHFTEIDGNGEFVVIFNTDTPDTSDYEIGYKLERMVDIHGDVTMFPTDRELVDPIV